MSIVLTALILVLGLVVTSTMLVGCLAARARQRERTRRLAAELAVEARLAALTFQTVQAMQQIARERLRGERP